MRAFSREMPALVLPPRRFLITGKFFFQSFQGGGGREGGYGGERARVGVGSSRMKCHMG